MSKNYNSQRRDFLKLASVLSLAPALSSVSEMALATPSEIVVGIWGGDYQRIFQELMAAPAYKNSLDITYEVGSSATRLIKLKAERHSRRSSMDVAMLDALEMYEVSTLGAMAEISPVSTPNLIHVIEMFKKPYAVPHIFSAMVLVYNKERMEAPIALSTLFNNKYQGRIGMADTMYNYNMLFMGLADGGSSDSYDSGRKVFHKIKSLKPRVYPSNEAVAAAFKSEEIWVAPMWKARALQWRDAGLPLEFVLPAEGAISAVFESAVPKNSRNKEGAFNFLNALLDPFAQQYFAQGMGYAPTINNANLPAELQARVGFTEDELKRIHHYDLKALSSERAACLDYWNKEFKAGL